MKICIAGKNRIAVGIAQFVQQHFPEIQLFGCVNSTDNGVNGWQPSFDFFCRKNGIPILTQKELKEIPDLLLLSLEFDKIIKVDEYLSDRLFNIHFSLLPAYKGMFTSIMPILNGERQSGVTLHRIDRGIDTGAIVAQVAFEIEVDCTGRMLYEHYLDNGIQLVKRNVKALIEQTEIAVPQKAIGASYYSKKTIDFGNVVIDLNKSAFEIYNQIRAFSFRDYQLPVIHGFPIYKAEISAEPSRGKSGAIVEQNDFWFIIETIDYRIKLFIDQQETLFKAVETGSVEKIKTIRNQQYPIDVRNKLGWDIFIIACHFEQIELIKLLLDWGWNINTCNYKGTTALMYAMTSAGKSGSLEVLKLLSEHLPDWKRKDDKDRDIFSYADEYGNPEVIEFIKNFK